MIRPIMPIIGPWTSMEASQGAVRLCGVHIRLVHTPDVSMVVEVRTPGDGEPIMLPGVLPTPGHPAYPMTSAESLREGAEVIREHIAESLLKTGDDQRADRP